VTGLAAALAAVAPDLVVVSGDLTQRARRAQFRDARAFLDALPAPWLAVPGNHDVPLWDLARRVLSPLGRFRGYIEADPAPLALLPGARVLGLDSTRRKVSGRLLDERLAPIEGLLAGPEDDLRVLVTHHPLVRRPLQGAEAALAAAARAHVDLALAGHHHHFSVTEGELLAVEAPSALSERVTHKGFNVVRATAVEIAVTPWAWNGEAFAAGQTRTSARRLRRDGAAVGWAGIPAD